jgi:hypothetical protein
VSADGVSGADDALVYFHSVAPEDVLRAVASLQSEGWGLHGVKGGQTESFGNVLVELTRADGAIKIVRDRSQWAMDIKLAAWNSWFDLSIIMDAKAERTTWNTSSSNPYEVKQLPEGVHWADVLTEVLSWLTSVNDVEIQLTECRSRRFHERFPVQLPRKSS